MSSAQFTLSTKDITPNSAIVVVTLGIQYASPETATVVVETDGIVVYNDVFTIPAGDVGDTVDIPLTSLKSNTAYTATITSMSAYSDLINFSTPVNNTPKVATQTQWEDLISRIDWKDSEYEVDTGLVNVDNKKKYKRTFRGLISQNITNIPYAIPTGAELDKVEGVIRSGVNYQIPLPFYSSENDYVRFYIDPSYNLTILSGSIYYNEHAPTEFLITLYYTKD